MVIGPAFPHHSVFTKVNKSVLAPAVGNGNTSISYMQQLQQCS